jgi:N-acyl amino acid synthase FeeM
MKLIDHTAVINGNFATGVMQHALRRQRIAEERLPFTVKIVRSEEALQKAVTIRQAAYARHVPAFAAKLGMPEPNDHDRGSVVLLAESRLDGSPLGTMRIQTNRFRDLAIAQSVELPAWLKNKSMAEATRLGVAPGQAGRVVKTTLFKSFFRYCQEADVEWMVIAARPPLDRQYEALLFEDLFPGQVIPMRHVNNIPHCVLAFEVGTAEDRWAEAQHPLFKFVFQTQHPDIDLGDADVPTRNIPLRTAKFSARMAIGA